MSSTKKKFQIEIPEWFEDIEDFSKKMFTPLFYTGIILFVLLLIASVYGFITLPGIGFLRFLTVTFLSIGFLFAILGNVNRLYMGWVGVGGGIMLTIIMSFVVSLMTDRADMETQHAMVESMLPAVQTISFLVVFIAVTYLVYYLYAFSSSILSHKKEKTAQSLHYIDIDKFRVKEVEEKPNFIPTCWQTSRCRKGARKACPNFVDHKSCWDRCSGCFCDKQLAAYLVYCTNKAVAAVTPAISTVEQMRVGMQNLRKSWVKQKVICMECPVFVEHQLVKYEHFQWAGYPVAVMLMGIFYPVYNAGYEGTSYLITQGVNGTSIINESVKQSLSENSTMALAIEWTIFLAVTAILGSLLASFTHTVIMKWKM